ncbi:MAG: EpsG family protein [Bacteroidales bacterium]|nr:EpsG family protein [Bacteroidales bacterium]
MVFIALFPYIGLLLLTLLIPQFVNNKKRYMVFLFLVYFMFSGFRYGVGWDFFNYLHIIEFGGLGIDNFEFLVRQLGYFCERHGFTQFFFVATSFVIVLGFFLMFAKESENPAVSIFVFLCIPTFLLNSFTIIRYFLAVSAIFLSCHYGYKKQYVPYFLLLIAAFLCHKAALFGLITIPFVLMKKEFGFTTNLTIFITCFVFGTIIGSFSFISSMFNTLLESALFSDSDILESGERYMQDIGNANFSRTPYVFALINLINLFSFRRNNQIESEQLLGHYVTMYNIGCSLMFLFSFHVTLANRVSVLFTVFLTLIAPFYKNKPIAKIALYSICLFVFFFELTIRASHIDFVGRLNCWLPYRMNLSF